MINWLRRRRTATPPTPPGLSYEPLLAEMRGDFALGPGAPPLHVEFDDLRWRTLIAKQRREYEEVIEELTVARAGRDVRATPQPRRRPHPPSRVAGEHAEPSPDTTEVSTPHRPLSDAEILDRLRVIRDRDDPDHPAGTLPPQSVMRDEIGTSYRRLRPQLERLETEDDELRARRGA